MPQYMMFVDESGKLGASSDYTSLCGYVAHAGEWIRFGEEWESCLFKWQVPPIHMGRIMYPNSKEDKWKRKYEEWGSDWEIKREEMLQELVEIIQRANLICIGAVVDARCYRELLQDPGYTLHWNDSNVFAFHHIIMSGISRVETVNMRSPITIVVVDDNGTALEFYRMLDTLRGHPDQKFARVKDRIHAICFGNDSSYAGLQAADMIAYESRNLMRNQMNTPDSKPSMRFEYLTHGLSYQPKLYTARVLKELGRRTTEALRLGGADDYQI